MRSRHYRTLGLQPGASELEIKKAYRKKAMIYHPDKNDGPDAEEKFMRINQAYEALIHIEEEAENEQQDNASYSHRYRREMSPEEAAYRAEKARAYARYKEFKEKNIMQISYEQLQKNFIGKYLKFVNILCLLCAVLFIADYKVMDTKFELGMVLSTVGTEFELEAEVMSIEDATMGQTYNLRTMKILEEFVPHPSNTIIKAQITPLLGEKLSYRVEGYLGPPKAAMENYSTFYMGFYPIMVLLILPLMTIFSKGPNMVYMIFAHVNSVACTLGLIIALYNIIW